MKDLLLKRFRSYKDLGDKTFAQLSDIQFLWSYNSESNSIATLVQHISENMESQWSNFLPEDFEKSKINREIVFNKDVQSKAQLIEGWERGWAVLFRALNQIDDDTFNKSISVGEEKHSILDEVLRLLSSYAYHIGQITYIAEMLKDEAGKTLAIPKNISENNTLAILKNQIPQEIQENSSPVCFAKSDEIRDDYKL